MTLSLRDKGDRWRCSARGCCREVGLRKDTWLENWNLSYRSVVLFIYAWSKELTSMEYCKHELGIGHTTVVDWSNFLREVCAADLLANPLVIGGPGVASAMGIWRNMQRNTGIVYVCCRRQVVSYPAAYHSSSNCSGDYRYGRYVGCIWRGSSHGI